MQLETSKFIFVFIVSCGEQCRHKSFIGAALPWPWGCSSALRWPAVGAQQRISANDKIIRSRLRRIGSLYVTIFHPLCRAPEENEDKPYQHIILETSAIRVSEPISLAEDIEVIEIASLSTMHALDSEAKLCEDRYDVVQVDNEMIITILK
jgi:hypothetical protein